MTALTRFRYGVATSLVLLAALIALGLVAAMSGYADARLIQVVRFAATASLMLCALLLILNVVASLKIKHSA